MKLPNKGVPCPQEYVDDMRHYFPKMPLPAIKRAWLHGATPLEVKLHLERLEKLLYGITCVIHGLGASSKNGLTRGKKRRI